MTVQSFLPTFITAFNWTSMIDFIPYACCVHARHLSFLLFSLNVPLSTDFLMFIYGTILHVPPKILLSLSRRFFFFVNRAESTHCITITQNHHAINGRKSAWESDSLINNHHGGAMDFSKKYQHFYPRHAHFLPIFQVICVTNLLHSIFYVSIISH